MASNTIINIDNVVASFLSVNGFAPFATIGLLFTGSTWNSIHANSTLYVCGFVYRTVTTARIPIALTYRLKQFRHLSFATGRLFFVVHTLNGQHIVQPSAFVGEFSFRLIAVPLLQAMHIIIAILSAEYRSSVYIILSAP